MILFEEICECGLDFAIDEVYEGGRIGNTLDERFLIK